MRVYVWDKIIEEYAAISADDEKNAYHILMNLDGRSYVKDWTMLKYSKYVEHMNLPLGDNPRYIPGECIISKRAKDILSSYIVSGVEFLPVFIEDEMFYLVNPLEILTCLDREKSEYELLSENPFKIIYINKYVFKKEILENKYIFRMNGKKKRIFVTDRFVKLVEKNKLEGFGFKLVWDSEKDLQIGDLD